MSMELGIGGLSRASGVPTNTLRTWERRYGFPAGTRTPGGQRVYDEATIEHVRLFARALNLGGRPAQLVRASLDELRAFVRAQPEGVTSIGPSATLSPVASGRVDAAVPELVDAALALNSERLRAALQVATARSGMERFLLDVAAPFCQALGDAWAEGRLGVEHEHVASEHLREHLADLWRPLAAVATGPLAVLATLPGERHVLGLHMAACEVAAAGWRVLFLGADAPLPSVEAAVRTSGARAVLVSVSEAADPDEAITSLIRLRAALPPSTRLVVGGTSAPPESAFSAQPGDRRWDTLAGVRAWFEAER